LKDEEEKKAKGKRQKAKGEGMKSASGSGRVPLRARETGDSIKLSASALGE